jgi:hypothetical protein
MCKLSFRHRPRNAITVPVFRQIKGAREFTDFLLRGLVKVGGRMDVRGGAPHLPFVHGTTGAGHVGRA